jgi:hypothetical protein
MAEKAAPKPGSANSDHVALGHRTNEPSANNHPNRTQSFRDKRLRPSQIPLSQTTTRTGSSSLNGGRARPVQQRLRPSAAPVGAPLQIAAPTSHSEKQACQLEASISGTRPGLSGGGPRLPAVAPPIVHQALRTDDRPLDEPVRSWFAAELHDDLRDVRVHTGELASASTHEIRAHAYTVGRHVVLGSGLTEPTAFAVLAHELAHVAQRENVLHRYESGEHAQAGSTARKVTINGVTMDEGDLVALGDLYEKPEDIYKAPKAELQTLVDLIERDKKFYSGQGGKPVSNKEWSDATKTRPKDQQFLELAKRNDPHFAPLASGAPGPKGDHKAEWRKYHQQAILATIASTATGKSGVPEEAIVLNGFAAHFLTDAFAAGHLVNKDDAMAAAQTAWNKQTFSGTIFKESTFTKNVAHQVLSDPSVAALMAKKQLKEIAWGDVNETRFSEFIYQMSQKKPDLFFNAFARLVHDKLNESINDPANALEVTNAKGDTWKLSGDETLSKSPATLRIMQAAVAQSYSNLEAAAKLTATPADFEPYFKAVWDYAPTPTADGKKTLDGIVSTFTDPRNAKTVDAFAKLAIKQIDSLVSELTLQGYMRDRPAP